MSESRPTLADLETRDDFVRRHIGPGEPQIQHMLEALGLDSLEALQDKAVPPSIVSAEPMVLPPTMGERETLTYLRRMRDRNEVFISMIGLRLDLAFGLGAETLPQNGISCEHSQFEKNESVRSAGVRLQATRYVSPPTSINLIAKLVDLSFL